MHVYSQSALEMGGCTVGVEGLHGDCGWTVELEMLQGVGEDVFDAVGGTEVGSSA